MFDSVTVADLPDSGDLYAGYVNGPYKNYEQVCRRFPDRPIVSIATRASYDAMVLDVERYGATPAQAPSWAQRQRARGQEPTVYTLWSQWQTVKSAFLAAHIPQPAYWIARYDNKAELIPGAVAKQYGGNVKGHYDISIVDDYWPGVDMLTPQEAQELLTKTREIHSLLFDAKPHPYEWVPGMDGRLTDLWIQAGFPKK